MPLLDVRQITWRHGADALLDGIDLTIERGERVGLVGVNGSGKTTLCRIILGELEPHGGEVHLAGGARVGYLPQDPQLEPGRRLIDEAMSAFDDLRRLESEFAAASAAIGDAQLSEAELHERLATQSRLLAELEARGGFDYEQRLLSCLGGLGFGAADHERLVGTLSGGEKSRLALARLLMTGCDLLLLDEPTNHLDLAMTEWLEDFLKAFPGGALIVSHDRWFLDNVAQTIVELEGARAERYHFGEGEAKLPPPDDPDHEGQTDDVLPSRYGAYSHYVRVKADRRAAAWKAYATQQRELRRQEDWIRWKLNLRRGSHVRQARSRQKMLAGREWLNRPADDIPVVQLNFDPRTRGPNDIVELVDCGFGYGGRRLFGGLNLRVRRLDRVGIVGPNGCGKTTLLKLILGELRPTEGTARLGPTCDVAVYRQEQEDLDLAATPLEVIRAAAPDLPVPQIRGFLARFLFFGDDVFRPVGSFSGGERSRLVLARLIITRPNVLVLDEPTNHLDIPSREVLEEALLAFGGTILTVSHDRWFLSRLCRRLVVFEGDEVSVFEGGWAELAVAREEERRLALEQAEREKRERHRAHLERERAARRAKQARLQAAGGLTLSQLEARIESLEAELRAIHEQFGDPNLYTDGERVRAAQREEVRIREALADLYERWEALV